MSASTEQIDDILKKGYDAGFVTDIEEEYAPPGLSEEIVRFISKKKQEPEWLLEWRLKAYRRWLEMKEPTWAKVTYPKIDFQDICYYAAPKTNENAPKSLDEVDPELLATYEKLGIPLHEREVLAGVAVDAVFDSVSVATTFRDKLAEVGVIFMPFSEAVQEHPELVKRYLGSVVPVSDNFYAALNSAVFSDGSFVYIPKGVRCPMELSTYFRINAAKTGQFERTLIIADEGSYVSYLEGCTAPMRDENQLHAAVVELVTHEGAQIKYSTVQNWYPGDENGKGGILNFVTKRGLCEGARSKISWTQVETGSAITWKYPSCILKGDDSVGEFYSVALSNHRQQADTGTKMIHLGKNTKSTIISKGISAGHGQQTYRGGVKISRGATNARNYTQCDSLLIGDKCGAHTVPYVDVRNSSSKLEHEATTSRIGEDQLFYCRQRGLSEEGGAKAPRRQLGRSSRLMLKIEDLHVEVDGKPILKGINLEIEAGQVHAIMGPNGSGKSTLAYVLAGKDGYEVTKGRVLYKGQDLLEMAPELRAAEGLFLGFQYPVAIPGVSNIYFLKAAVNAIRKHRGEDPLDAIDFMKLSKEKAALVQLPDELTKRSVNDGFSGGEKKRNEIFQMAMLEPSLAVLDETDSGLDIDALKVVAEGVNALRGPDRAMLVITHYQRLLDHIVPDVVHVLIDGQIVRTGDKGLAMQLEKEGYAGVRNALQP